MNVHPETTDPRFRYGPWKWSDPIRGEHFRRCSFCGSIHPDDLVAEPEWQASWTDMKYGWPHKFYVDIPNRDPDLLYVVASVYGGTGLIDAGYIPWGKLDRRQRKIAKAEGYGDRDPKPTGIRFGTRASHFGKFYTVHLGDPEISAETKAAIECRSGLVFTFTDDGRVTWRAVGS